MLFIKYINCVQLVGKQIYNLDIARIKNNTKVKIMSRSVKYEVKFIGLFPIVLY